MSEQHDKFLKRLDGSRVAVFRVGEWLHRKGFTVTIPSISYAPDARSHMDHVDDGDILISRPSAKHEFARVEVKHIQHDFDCVENYPFKRVVIASKDVIDRADPEPLVYVIVNKEMTHGGLVYYSERDKWFEYPMDASNTGNREMKYAVLPEYVKFVDLRA